MLETQALTVADEFWSAKQRGGHSIHEISYRACFKPALPEYFIARYAKPGASVLDPFMGRGTTPIQAAIMGRRAVGSDVNPLAVMLTAPRLAPPALAEVAERLQQIARPATVIPESDKELSVFFHPQVLATLVHLKNYFAARARADELDAVDNWIRMVLLNRLTGHSPGFLSVRSMPPNQAVSVSSQRKINRKSGLQPQRKDFARVVLRKSRSLLRSGIPVNGGRHLLQQASAERLDYLRAGEIDLIVTSPPFLNTVNYKNDNWLRCWFAGIAVDELQIAHFRKVPLWRAFIARCLAEFCRVLRPGGRIAFEVGEVRAGAVLLEKEVIAAAAGLPLALRRVLINTQHFTKTSNCWGVSNNQKGTNSNRVVLLERVQGAN